MHIVCALLLAILLTSGEPAQADDKYPEGYNALVGAAIELYGITNPTPRQQVEAAIAKLRAERNNRMPQDYEIRQELTVPGGNWNSPEGEVYNLIIDELLGQ